MIISRSFLQAKLTQLVGDEEYNLGTPRDPITERQICQGMMKGCRSSPPKRRSYLGSMLPFSGSVIQDP